MPAWLSAPCDNGRGKEEAYFIGETVNVFYGSANSKNNDFINDTRKHTNFNVMNHVFCPKCESNLGVIENALVTFLDKIVPSGQGFDKENKTITGLSFKEYSRIDLAELKLFFYTVVWRLSLSEELNRGVKTLSDEQNERLRSVIHKFLSDDLSKITGNKELLNEMPLTILTSQFSDTTKNVYSPPRIDNNPPLFMACCYLVFIHFNEHIVLNPNFNLPLGVFDKSLVNKNEKSIKIGFLKHEDWDFFLNKELDYEAKKFIAIRIAAMMKATGKNYVECGKLLDSRARELQVEQLISKLGKSKEECARLYAEHGEAIIEENYLKRFDQSFDDAFIEASNTQITSS